MVLEPGKTEDDGIREGRVDKDWNLCMEQIDLEGDAQGLVSNEAITYGLIIKHGGLPGYRADGGWEVGCVQDC